MTKVEQDYIKRRTTKKFKELEKEAKKIFLGAKELDNDVKLNSCLFADTDNWEYVIKLYISINGAERTVHKKVSMDEVDSPQKLSEYMREMCVRNLAKFISAKFFRQNLKTINEMESSFVG
tara:strand:- start:205 stop:567 length:363 start_codon:yes stop_codon:yes gene_type:complete